jgi:hypothetical protein
MDNKTQWVKDNVYGISESSAALFTQTYIDYLIEHEIDYFNDFINEAIEKIDAYDLFANIARSHDLKVNVKKEKSFINCIFLADLIKILHDIEEIEESEPDDFESNSDRLMGEHR